MIKKEKSAGANMINKGIPNALMNEGMEQGVHGGEDMEQGVHFEHIFPTALGFCVDDMPMAEEYESIISDSEWRPHGDNEKLLISKDTYILDSMMDSNLRKFIQKSLDEYSEKVLSTKEKLKITQSWAVKHEEGIPNLHSKHAHPNSIISGVYYLLADEKDNEGITFFKTNYDKSIQWEMDDSIEPDSSIYERYTVPITRGRMVLFQSSLEHGVLDQTGGNKDRISLSFNTWFENGVGSEKGLSKL